MVDDIVDTRMKNVTFRGRLRTSRYSAGRHFAPWHAFDFDRLGLVTSRLVEEGEKVISWKRLLFEKHEEK